MFARVASFEGVDFAAAEETLEQAEAIGRPLIGALAWYVGNFELAAANGKVLSVTLFDTEEHAEAAEHTFDEVLPAKLGRPDCSCSCPIWVKLRRTLGKHLLPSFPK